MDELLPYVYDELRSLARGRLNAERNAETLQPTALVNEVYLRLVDQRIAGVSDRSHFVALCARVMRRILVDRARQRNAAKRDGGEREPLTIAVENVSAEGSDLDGQGEILDVLALDKALADLAALDERRAKVVELRYFSGMTMDEVAKTLDVSKRTAEGDWYFARAWLRRALDGETP